MRITPTLSLVALLVLAGLFAASRAADEVPGVDRQDAVVCPFSGATSEAPLAKGDRPSAKKACPMTGAGEAKVCPYSGKVIRQQRSCPYGGSAPAVAPPARPQDRT